MSRRPDQSVVVPISERAIMEAWALAAGDRPFVLTFPECDPPIPADAEVLAVHHDWLGRRFLFRVEHPSFPVVKEGDMPPMVDVVWKQQATAEAGQ